MPPIYDNDFQGFAVGAIPPYGNLFQAGAANPVIVDNPPGIWGDVKSVFISTAQALIFPTQTPGPLDTFYSEFTFYMGFRMGTTTNQQGTLLLFLNANFPFAAATITNFIIFADGTLGFVENTATFPPVQAVSDFSLYTQQWDYIRVDIRFSNVGGFVAFDAEVFVDGLSVLTAHVVTTNVIATLPGGSTYVNAVQMAGAGVGSLLGRLTIYDAIQAPGFYPHPGAREARVDQGLIELVVKAVSAVPSLACPIGGGLAQIGQPYSAQLIASGGTSPYISYLITSGGLPPGLNLNPVTGALTGTPIAAGLFSYTATVTDAAGATASANCAINVTVASGIVNIVFYGIVRFLVRDAAAPAGELQDDEGQDPAERRALVFGGRSFGTFAQYIARSARQIKQIGPIYPHSRVCPNLLVFGGSPQSLTNARLSMKIDTFAQYIARSARQTKGLLISPVLQEFLHERAA